MFVYNVQGSVNFISKLVISRRRLVNIIEGGIKKSRVCARVDSNNSDLESRLERASKQTDEQIDSLLSGNADRFYRHLTRKTHRDDPRFSREHFLKKLMEFCDFKYSGIFFKEKNKFYCEQEYFTEDSLCDGSPCLLDTDEGFLKASKLGRCAEGVERLVIPIMYRGEQFGCVVFNKQGEISFEDVVLVNECTHDLSRTLAMTNQIRYLQKLAEVDDLTGLYNYRRFVRDFDVEFNKWRRTGKDFALLSFDIDKFKKVNDTYNHVQGDYVLREIAKLMRTDRRRLDSDVYRTGGEEFRAILRGTSSEDATKVALAITDRVNNYPFEPQAHINNPKGTYDRRKSVRVVTISSGVCSTESLELEDPDAKLKLLSNAELNLYFAKWAGRNQVFTGKPMKDNLTGLENTPALAERLEKSLIETAGNGNITSLFIFDVDHFSSFKDRYGNDSWNIIREIARQFRTRYSKNFDYVARLGQRDRIAAVTDNYGDFAEIELQNRELADKLVEDFEHLYVPLNNDRTVGIDEQIPVSIGIVMCSRNMLDGKDVTKYTIAGNILDKANDIVDVASESEGRVSLGYFK